MRKPRRGLVMTVGIPFLMGCFHVTPRALPEPGEPRPTAVRGVVLAGPNEHVQFTRVDRVEWTDSTLVLTGEMAPGTAVTRSYRLDSLSGVLVREMDANRASIIIGGVIVGGIAVAALLITGKGDGTTVVNLIPLPRH